MLASVLMPFDTIHPPKYHCRTTTLSHGGGTPRWPLAPQQDNVPHSTNFSGKIFGTRQRAQSNNLASKLLGSQSNQEAKSDPRRLHSVLGVPLGYRHIPQMLDALGTLGARSVPRAPCHIPLAIPEDFLWCGMVHYPVGGGTAFREWVYLVCNNVWVGDMCKEVSQQNIGL